MLKILVPTDFSTNSKAGIRFAMQWSEKQKTELRFVHFFHTKRLLHWTDAVFRVQTEKEAALFKLKLEKFIGDIYKSTKFLPGNYTCTAAYGLSADIAILNYCRVHARVDYICISTRGAGKFDKLLGTHTGNLITKSKVPVITVPKNYRISPVKTILYATDFQNYAEELKKVVSFARPLEAEIHVLHLNAPNEIIPAEIIMNKTMKNRLGYSLVDLQVKKRTTSHSLLKDLHRQILHLKPSLIIMFTDQRRNFLQKLLSPSKTEQVSFVTSLPLLSFNKI